jgi:hypothetical protein
MRCSSIVFATVLAMVLLLPPARVSAQADVSGRLADIEPGSRTLYFTDGRIVTLEPGATLWVDGRQLPIETVRRGMTVSIRDVQHSSKSGAAAVDRSERVVAAHPSVDASGTIASIDADGRMVTLQDGRMFKLGNRAEVWEASNLDDIKSGEQVYLRNAQPAGYPSSMKATPDRMRMGRVTRIDGAHSMVLLDNGTWVVIKPTTRMRLNGKQSTVRLQPGDEVLVVIAERQPGATAQTDSGDPAVNRDTAAKDSPSAMPREDLVGRGDVVQADEIQIFRRPQTP